MKINFKYHQQEFSLAAPDGDYVGERVQHDGTFYEVDLLEELGVTDIPEGALVVDVGANVGNHTVYFGGVMGLRVMSIEPEARNAEFLRANIEANGLADRVTIVPCALGAQPARGRLVQQIAGNSGTFALVTEPTGSIEVRTLDEVAKGLGQVALIKIDVEGHEVQVLEGARETLKAHRPVITTECHSSTHFAAVSAVLSPLGYSVVDIAGRSENFIWVHEEAAGAVRFANIREAMELRRIRRKFHQVLTATDRISNLLQNEARTEAGWRAQVNGVLEAIGASSSKAAEVAERGDLSVYWKALADMLGDIQGKFYASEERLTALRHELLGLAAQFPRELEHLRVALLRGVGRQFDGQGRLGAAVERIEHAMAANHAEVRQGLGAGAMEIRQQLDAGMGHLGQSLEASMGELRQAVDVGINRSLQGIKAELDERNNAQAHRELSLNDLTQKLLSCQDQLRVLTQELVLARTDQERLLAASQDAKRGELAQALSAREWEIAYRLLHGSRALRLARGVRAFTGRSQPAHDASTRRAEIADTVERNLRTMGVERAAPAASGLREVPNPRRQGRERVRAGVATMPGRESGLAVVLDSICPQVDEVFVYLNGFKEPPSCVLAHDNVRAFIGPDIGDRGKFRFIDGYSGYFISIDDDIAYPEFYVQTLIDGIERYGRKAAVGWHGSILLDGFKDYYDPKSRRVLTFGSERGADTQVHILGTGCTAFHTDTIKVSYSDFLKPNMADIFFALEGQRQKVPFMVLAHRKGWAAPIEFKNSPSISGESMKSSGSRIDVRTITNELVMTQGKWNMPKVEATYSRKPFTLALIGRTDKERWKKGGILKSSHLTKKMLDPYGVTTHLVDIEKGDVENLGGADPQIVMIYPGDPDRPDYKKVEYLVDFHASRGRIVLVNLSLNSVAARNEFVCRRISAWRKVHGNRVRLMTFTDRAKDLQALAPVADAIFAVPKTIEVPSVRARSFAGTEGIFLGDYGKLCDEILLGYPVEEALAALRAALPGVPLYAVKQYAPKVSKDLGIRVLPYLSDDYAATLRSARLMVSMVKYATFEMVPAELAAMGIPIVHPRMSFSLSDYLGLSAFEVETVAELVETTALLYSDPMAWEAASASSELRGASADFRRLSAQMYARLLRLAHSVPPDEAR
ncbi:FkbM family methyltransferase [Lysobacter yangpyeongensis]|uniref:FkbM family methyltransferase n=1 Tax=Lysobacter yangpyeongensis TaxID=346182 RepID=A0ABW0SR46_9GAMM